MPLSEHEQRLLEQIEQGLYAEDPKFASTVRKVRVRSGKRRRIIVAVTGAVVGLGVVLLALVTQIIVIGVVGFVLIVAGCAYGVGGRGPLVPNGPQGIVGSNSTNVKSSRRNGGMKERMEDRIRRRFDEQ